MYNALLIKNADFSEYKTRTIEFSKPCTGIAFDESSVTLDALGSVTVDYTVTPADTSDAVSFTSSDASVITVNGSTLTAVGIGECTLTVTCGSHSDTCDVTVDAYEHPLFANATLRIDSDEVDTSLTGLAINNSSRSNLASLESFSKGNFDNPLVFTYGPDSYVGETEPIKIPENVGAIHVYATNLFSMDSVNTCIIFLDPDVTFTRYNRVYPKIISKVVFSDITSRDGKRILDEIVSVPEGSKGYVIFIQPTMTRITDITTIDTQEGLQDLAYDEMQLSIRYLESAAE